LKFTLYPYYKRNFRSALPIILSFLGQSTVQIVDSLMIGWLGATPLAAASLAGAVIMNVLVIGMGISMALTPIVGREWGERNFRTIASYFQNSLLLNLVASFALSLLLVLILYLLPFFGQPVEVVGAMRGYYIYLTLSILPFMLFQTFKQFMEGMGNTHIAMKITLVANGLNVVLNYLLIFGKLGFPQMGMEGAGLATFISRLFMPVAFYVAIGLKGSYFRFFKLFNLSLFSQKRLASLMRIGVPISGQMSIEFLSLTMITVMMGWISTESLAANQIALAMINLTFMIANGIAAASTIHVSHSFGKRDIEGVRKSGVAGMHLSLMIMGVAAILFLLFGREIASLFTSSEEVIAIATKLFMVVALFEILDGLQVSALGALRGISDVKQASIYALISYLLVSIPTAYIAGFVLNLQEVGLLSGFAAGLLVASTLFIGRFKRRCSNPQELFLNLEHENSR